MNNLRQWARGLEGPLLGLVVRLMWTVIAFKEMSVFAGLIIGGYLMSDGVRHLASAIAERRLARVAADHLHH